MISNQKKYQSILIDILNMKIPNHQKDNLETKISIGKDTLKLVRELKFDYPKHFNSYNDVIWVASRLLREVMVITHGEPDGNKSRRN